VTLFRGRRSIRLPHFDYSTAAAYFVTLCVVDRRPLLSSVDGADVHLTPIGKKILTHWQWLETQYPYVVHDIAVLMPDHLHGIIFLMPGREPRKPLGQLLGAFKTVSTKELNLLSGLTEQFWQRGFYEHVIRSDKALDQCREYILNNPLQWSLAHSRMPPYPWLKPEVRG
jgi:putative transposase